MEQTGLSDDRRSFTIVVSRQDAVQFKPRDRERAFRSHVDPSRLPTMRSLETTSGTEPKERQMKHLMLVSCAALALSAGAAWAGPCTTTSMGMQDAGSGPTTGHQDQAQTTGTANTTQQPPTSTMNREAGATAASPQDVQKQTQGKPTAAQEAEGRKPADQNC